MEGLELELLSEGSDRRDELERSNYITPVLKLYLVLVLGIYKCVAHLQTIVRKQNFWTYALSHQVYGYWFALALDIDEELLLVNEGVLRVEAHGDCGYCPRLNRALLRKHGEVLTSKSDKLILSNTQSLLLQVL